MSEYKPSKQSLLRDEVRQLRAELEKRTAGLHYANAVCMEMKHELARRDEKIDILEDALHKISNWCKAYPLEIADEPTEQEWKDAHVVMKEHGFNLSKFAVSAMRRVTTGVAKIADLEEDE